MISMMARSTASNQRPDTLLKGLTASSPKSSCNARPDHTSGSKPEELELSKCLPLSPDNGHSRCYIAHLAANRIFFKQLANRHDAHAAKIISFLQSYECCIIV